MQPFGGDIVGYLVATAWYKLLPTLNAGLNATAAVFLVAGYRAIRRGDVHVHRRRMITAFVVSMAFLASYVSYHVIRQTQEGVGHTPFAGPAILRPFYLGLLLSHLLLAMVNLPLVLITLATGLRGRYVRHRRVARWTWPIWVYVSITGVGVYLALYHI